MFHVKHFSPPLFSFDKTPLFLHNSKFVTPRFGVELGIFVRRTVLLFIFGETSGPLLNSRMFFLGGFFKVTASFRDFNLPESFLAALDQRGFTEPTQVQEQVLSQTDLQRDMVVQARTGSGKTLAFLLPILSELEGGNKNPRVLVLSPTRELAMQNANESEFFGRIKGLGTAAIVGGMSMEHQIFTALAVAALLAALFTVAGLISPSVAEIGQCRKTLVYFKYDISAVTAVTAVGSAVRNIFLPPEADMSVASFT